MVSKIYCRKTGQAFVILLGILCIVSCGTKESQTIVPTAVTERPNIILVFADDIGFADIGVNGQKNFSTPNIDQMAKEGMNFTQFYSGAAVCAPSRSVLLTGQNQGSTRVRANLRDDVDENGNKIRRGEYLYDEDFTLAELFKKANYDTALVGKWGLGEIDNEGHPNKQGFDYFYGYLNHIHAHNHYPEYLWRNTDKVFLKNKPEDVDCKYCPQFGFAGQVTPVEHRVEFADDLIRDEAVEFIEKQADKKSPFFLMVSLISPHANNEAEMIEGLHGMEVPSYGEFEHKEWPDSAKGYAAMMSHIDDTVGRIRQALVKNNLDKNTIVIFTGDNGAHQEAGNDPEFHNSSGILRGIKRDAYEGGARVPTVFWGGPVSPGLQSDHIGYSGDFMATFAEFLNIEPPSNLHSLSIVPTLKGLINEQKKHDYLYWEFYEHGSSQSVRMGDWKAVRIPMLTGKVELYNLKNDPSELNDVADAHQDIVERIEKIMADNHHPSDAWRADTKSKSPDRLNSRVGRLSNSQL